MTPSIQTPMQIVILIATLLVGFAATAVQTGSFLGIKTVPKPWLPYLTLAVGVLSGMLNALRADAAQGAALSGSSLLLALYQGLLSLGSTTVGVGVALHFATHKMDFKPCPGGTADREGREP